MESMNTESTNFDGRIVRRFRQPPRPADQPIRVFRSKIVKAANLPPALVLLLLVTVVSLSRAQNNQPADKARNHSADQNSSTQGNAARGQYIVEDLSRCGQCHTPRESDGTPDRSRWLQGAPVWLKSAEPVDDWPLQAPRIAGALPGTDAEMVALLTTGIWRTGTYLRPPMPQFRMSRQDAESVIAYLKSVKSAPK
jgi:mono/diheme cytochrome c family protein